MLSRTGRASRSASASGFSVPEARAAAATFGDSPVSPRTDRRHAVVVVGAAPRRAIARSTEANLPRETLFRHLDPSSSPRGFAAGALPSADEAREDERDEASDVRKKKKDDERDATRAMTERLLAAATRHVAEHGWSKAALFAAADDLGYSRAVVGSVRNGAGALVHHFCEDCDSRLSVRIVMEQEDALDPLLPSERLATAIKWRLEMLEPVIESWPAALAAQAAPENAAATATRVALLADELVGVMGAQGVGLSRATTAAMASPGLQDPIPPEKETNRQTGDDDADADADARGETAEADAQKKTPLERDPKKKRGGTVSTVSPSKKPFATAFASAGWYADRAAVAALYGACELFMVGDTSPGFEDTRAFVDARARELAQFAAAAEEAATSAAAASRSVGLEPGTLDVPFALPAGTKQLVEGVFAKVLETATRAGGTKR